MLLLTSKAASITAQFFARNWKHLLVDLITGFLILQIAGLKNSWSIAAIAVVVMYHREACQSISRHSATTRQEGKPQ